MIINKNKNENQFKYNYDAFGDALGNSIVSGLQKKQTQANVDKATQVGNEVYEREISLGKSPKEAKFVAAQAIAKSSGGAVSLNEIAADGSLPSHGSINSLDETTGFYLSNNTDRGFISYSASMSDVSQFLAGSPAYGLGMQHAAQMFGIKASGDMAFARGVARGEAMYAAGVRNREQIGVDFTQFNNQVDSYIKFRDGQRMAFQAKYDSYNGFQKFAFNTGANLFGGLVYGGQALGDATALLGIQGSDAFSSGWSNVGDTLSYVAQNPVDALIVNPATAAYNRYSSIYNSDGFGAAAGTFAGDLLSGVPFAALGAARPLSIGSSVSYKTSLPETLPTGIYADTRGVYGYLPEPGSRYSSSLYDFSDSSFVARNRQIRLDYLNGSDVLEVAINDMRLHGVSSERIANRVVIQRNSQKIEARSLMTPNEVRILESGNIKRYGDPVGPTPLQMFDKYGDWDVVIQKSMMKDPAINMLLGISKSR